jgi:hypothetical protein
MALAATLQSQALPITPRHRAWLANPTPFTQEALDFAAWELGGNMPQRKRRLLRASGFGQCMRKRMFQWHRLEEPPVTPILQDIFQTGSFLHLKWQMIGLTEGWMVSPEEDFPNYEEDNLSGARIDGIDFTGALVEIKTINAYGYKRVVSEQRPKYDHVGQTHYSMINSGIREAAVIYDCKDTGEWIELRIKQSEHFTDKVGEELDLFNAHRRNRTLPDPLEGEAAKECGRCVFQKVCPSVEFTTAQWNQAEAIKEEEA